MSEIMGLPPAHSSYGLPDGTPQQQWAKVLSDMEINLQKLWGCVDTGDMKGARATWRQLRIDFGDLKMIAESNQSPANVKIAFEHFAYGTPSNNDLYAGTWNYLVEMVGKTDDFASKKKAMVLNKVQEGHYATPLESVHLGLNLGVPGNQGWQEGIGAMTDPTIWNEGSSWRGGGYV